MHYAQHTLACTQCIIFICCSVRQHVLNLRVVPITEFKMAYNYTKPRVPIDGQYTGPGPARYLLPTLFGHDNHDPRSGKYRAPAYLIGILLPEYVNRNPGPKYLIDPKMQTNGKEEGPFWSLADRVGYPSFLTPAPNAYHAEKADVLVYYKNPEYIFGDRLRGIRLDQIPGKYSRFFVVVVSVIVVIIIVVVLEVKSLRSLF